MLVIGNPTTTSGTFFDAWHSKSEGKNLFSIKPSNHPNIIKALNYLKMTWDEYKTYEAGDEKTKLPKGWKDEIPGALSLRAVERWKTNLGISTPLWDAMAEGEFPNAADNARIRLS